MPQFVKEDAVLLALTPEIPDSSMSTAEKNQLEFEVLSDIGNKVADDYGVLYSLEETVADMYQNSFDLHAYNGDTSDKLPLAATYVINTQGQIVYAFLKVDYRERAEPDEILDALKAL